MTCFDLIQTYFDVGLHDAICGLPIDPDLEEDEEYQRGRKAGEKANQQMRDEAP